ncbi:uncharacterized protein METZ01_LOCUS305376, partial [marine metagenome]
MDDDLVKSAHEVLVQRDLPSRS